MSELRNIKWGKLLRDTFLSKEGCRILRGSYSLQWALTYALRQQSMMVIDDLEDLVLEYKGIKFYPDILNYPRMFEAGDRYRVERVRPGDIVLDLGANIGSFTLPAARVAKEVIAVEPLFYEKLKRNLGLNNFNSTWTIHNTALGIGWRKIRVDCQEYSSKLYASDPREFLKKKVDFLRMDIGGSEWTINPALLNGIRDLEIEFHYWEPWQRKIADWPRWRSWLETNEYGYRARWSKHCHWLYLSASKDMKIREEVHLSDGSFRGRSREHWRGSQETSLQ